MPIISEPCYFCGRDIDRKGVDACSVTVRLFRRKALLWFCHAACLKRRLAVPSECQPDMLTHADQFGIDGELVISDLDIWRAASLLIQKHGVDAELEAAKCSDLMLDRGDDDGRLQWTRIRRAIEALHAPPTGKPN